jgi:hypothetical protein
VVYVQQSPIRESTPSVVEWGTLPYELTKI